MNLNKIVNLKLFVSSTLNQHIKDIMVNETHKIIGFGLFSQKIQVLEFFN